METEFEVVSDPTKTWILDRGTCRVIGTDDGLRAMVQTIDIILSTERYRWQIFTENFGIELEDIPGSDRAYIEAEIPRRIEDALSVDDRIESVEDFEFSQTQSGSLLCSFNVNTVWGSFGAEVNVI